MSRRHVCSVISCRKALLQTEIDQTMRDQILKRHETAVVITALAVCPESRKGCDAIATLR